MHAQGEPSGFELALHGTTEVLAGRPAHFRGIVYKVHGLAELRALPSAAVRGRYFSDEPAAPELKWQAVQADAHGAFLIEVPIPAETTGNAFLQIAFGDGKAERSFKFPLRVADPYVLDLVTDRILYEPGETVHVWARLRDQRSRRPLHREALSLTVDYHSTSVVTDESGVASLAIPIAKEASEGGHTIEARIGSKYVSTSYRVGTRTMARLFAEVKVTPETANPSQPVEVSVKVTSASGAPVRNATVEVHLDKEQTATAVSDAQGVARLGMHAPAYLVHSTGAVAIRAELQHPAYGSAVASGTLRLAVPLTLDVEAVPPNGGLVPELDGRLYLKVEDGAGQPPPIGTAIEVKGAAIAGGKQLTKTDVHGLAVVPTRLPPGSATSSDDKTTTTVKVRVEGPIPRTAAISVPVLPKLDVVPTVDRPVVAPGDTVGITLARRRSALGQRVVVELLAATGIIGTVTADARASRVSLHIPPDRIGVLRVRARPLLQAGVVEGQGGVDALLVRPPHPSFLQIQADRELYEVRQTAKLTLLTHPGAARSWGAVLVRDLAAHEGERVFSREFLEESFDRAVLDPASGAKETLLRTVLAADVYEDDAPTFTAELCDKLGRPVSKAAVSGSSQQRWVLRDPFPLADELRRRGIASVMKNTEAALASALDDGRLGELTTGRGRERHFRESLVEQLSEVPPTLGDGALTLAMLEASDPSFSYHNVARRVARARLVKLLVALAGYLDPGDDAPPALRAAAREPYSRWLTRMVTRGQIRAEDLADPWGGRFMLRPKTHPSLIIAREALGLELCSAGPDGVFGTADDVNDVFARAVPAGTPYAVASGEDELMERLSYLSPAEMVLTRLLEAYRRVAAEVAEEQRGDAVKAQVSEGDVGDSFGAGGLGLSGMGAGGGGSANGVGLGRIGTIGRGAGVGQGLSVAGIPGLAQLLREKFPPTLLFLPSVLLSPSGKTVVELKLPDAVTTYLVEAIVWSADGWTFSNSTRIRVDKETVVDAPVPRYATVGDSLLLPVRVSNHGKQDLSLGLLFGLEDQGPAQRPGVHVAASDAAEISVPLLLGRAMDAKVVVAVQSAAGAPLDAVRRPLTVQAPARRVRHSEELLARGAGTLTLAVPPSALAKDGAEVRVEVGLGIFNPAGAGLQVEWRDAWLGRSFVAVQVSPSRYLKDDAPLRLAQAIGGSWAASQIPDEQLKQALTALSRVLGKLPHEAIGQRAESLLGLAPAIRHLDARRPLAGDLESILRALRKELTSSVAGAKEDAEQLAVLAAALAATSPPGAELALVRELVRRARRSELRIGSDTWIASSGARPHAATALVALAEVMLGEDSRAFERLHMLAAIERDGGSLDEATRVTMHLVASLLSKGPEPRAVSVEIDGRNEQLLLEHGRGRLPAGVLSSPGQHRIQVQVPGGQAPVYVRASTEYGLPWELVPSHPGSLALLIDDKAQAQTRDQRARIELVLHNRSPRTIGRPIVELSVPTGAELDEDARRTLRPFLADEPDATRGTLHLELHALPPGSSRRLPLPLRWSVAGQLQGLGAVAFPADQTADLSILKPRVWAIAAPELKP